MLTQTETSDGVVKNSTHSLGREELILKTCIYAVLEIDEVVINMYASSPRFIVIRYPQWYVNR